jgi:glucose-1-phosphate cytidylyltransferase
MKTVILCGGRGTRLREYTDAVPKVLVEVGAKPILWHIMKGYSAQGFSDFVLALGYLGDQIRRYAGDGAPEDGWQVTCVETGQETGTGGRIKKIQDLVREDTFFATYGDGVSDIHYGDLLTFHQHHGKLATLTVVRPALPFGLVDIGADRRVKSFREKPLLQAWINGGFFVFNSGVFEYLDEESALEAEPFERLAQDGELMAYEHEGYWACMDTYKDNVRLNEEWQSGRAPWRTWRD